MISERKRDVTEDVTERERDVKDFRERARCNGGCHRERGERDVKDFRERARCNGGCHRERGERERCKGFQREGET